MMPSLAQLLTLVALVAVSSSTAIAPILERAASAGHFCADPKVSSQTTINVKKKIVTVTNFQCAAASVALVTTTLSPRDVCGASCTLSCNNLAGILPPISDDCVTIQNAIGIFQNQTKTFVLDSNHLKALTFGTCSYFFQNNDIQQLQYCWADLNVTAQAAGAACFPPVQPFFSEGLCTALDSTWASGAAHS